MASAEGAIRFAFEVTFTICLPVFIALGVTFAGWEMSTVLQTRGIVLVPDDQPEVILVDAGLGGALAAIMVTLAFFARARFQR